MGTLIVRPNRIFSKTGVEVYESEGVRCVYENYRHAMSYARWRASLHGGTIEVRNETGKLLETLEVAHLERVQPGPLRGDRRSSSQRLSPKMKFV